MQQQPPLGWQPPPGWVPQGYGPPPKPKTSTGTMLVAALLGVCALCCIGGIINKGNAPGGTSPTGTPAPAERQYLTQSCSEVAHLFGMQSQMSELQQTELWRQYDNKWVRWTVRAGEVGETFGTLHMQFKCGSESLILDGTGYFPDSARAQLLGVQVGSQVQIEGRLSDHGRLLGLRVDDATIR